MTRASRNDSQGLGEHRVTSSGGYENDGGCQTRKSGTPKSSLVMFQWWNQRFLMVFGFNFKNFHQKLVYTFNAPKSGSKWPTAPQLGTGGCSSHSSQPGSIYGHNHLGAVAVILEGLDIITYDMGKMVTNREVPMDLFQVFFWGGEGWNIAFGWLSIMALTCMCWSITSKRFKKWCSFDWCSNLLNTTWKHSGE